MKIKLPDDRNERIKILFMAGLFGIGILYVLVAFVVLPYFAAVSQDRRRLAELDELLWRAERDINQTERNRTQNAETIQQILGISEIQRHILRPSLGNYLLVAEDILKRAVQDLPVEILSIREISGVPPPIPETGLPAGRGALWPYSVTINLHANLHTLVRFTNRLRRENPYLAITSLNINAGPPTVPVMHNISIQIQWPVWSDPEHPNRLAAELLADEEQR